MAAFGWTWEYVDDNMTLPRYYEISKQWEKWPPMHLAVLSYMGYADKDASTSSEESKHRGNNEASIADLQQLFGDVQCNVVKK